MHEEKFAKQFVLLKGFDLLALFI
ncbi:hypothetical protein LCGC14_1729510, partial [marine sediment metagenome]